MNQRELGRKERATEEINRMCRRYNCECGDIVVHKLTPKQIQDLNNGAITLENLKLDRKNDNDS